MKEGVSGTRDLQAFHIVHRLHRLKAEEVSGPPPPISHAEEPNTRLLDQLVSNLLPHRAVDCFGISIKAFKSKGRIEQEELGDKMTGEAQSVHVPLLDALLQILHLGKEASQLVRGIDFHFYRSPRF